jgi:Tol biopolymer transport system component
VIYEKASSGAGEEKELLKKPGETLNPVSWSRDGRFLLYVQQNTPKTGNDIWVLPLGGEPKPVLLLATEFNEGQPRLSPDGRWISYNSNDSGRAEIYVRPFDASGPALGQGKWQISKDGGQGARWRADGKQIIFRAPDGSPMAVDVTANGAAFQTSAPRQLFPLPPGAATDWDVTPDGRRFLIPVRRTQAVGDEPITVVLNWKASLKR